MKAIVKKHPGIVFTLSLLLLLLLLPIFLYLITDVAILKKSYPAWEKKDKNYQLIFQSEPPRYWIKSDHISQNIKWAIILSEDWSFYQHPGFDWEQIKMSFLDLSRGEKLRGASTITQQTVKNIFLTHERSLWRKFREFILAYKMEQNFSKNEILEIYLNAIEYGPGILGIKHATQHYFKKMPSQVSPREAAFLAMMLPSPRRYYVSFKKKKLTDFARKRIEEVLTKMRMGKVISPEEYEKEIAGQFAWE